MKGEGKFEELVVCSHEIAACTAQLTVASKVKASRDSTNLKGLKDASKGVSTATAGVVASAKAGAEMVEEGGKPTIKEEFVIIPFLAEKKYKNKWDLMVDHLYLYVE